MRCVGVFLILFLGLFIGMTSCKNSGIQLDNPSSVVQTGNSDDGGGNQFQKRPLINMKQRATMIQIAA